MLDFIQLAKLSIGNPGWFPLIAVGLAVGFIIILYSYRKLSLLSPGKRFGGATLKLLGLILLALCLLELEWVQELPQKGTNLVAMLADTSRSLTITETAGKPTRSTSLKNALSDAENAETDSFINQIDQQFRLKKFTIDQQVRSIQTFTDLNFSGTASRLNSGLTEIADRFDGQPLAAVIVFTDGNYTDPKESFSQLPNLPPHYFIKTGKRIPGTDLALTRITVTESAFEDAPVTIEGKAQARGFKGKEAIASLIRTSDGETVASETLKFQTDSETRPIRFLFRPLKTGVSFYQVTIRPSTPIREATEANNTRLVTVHQNMGPHRILYLSGRPNWEFKYFRRALREDQSLRLSALQRIAKREPKFVWRGRTGEESNPLFRGFGREDETAEYDQPVLIRLFVESEEELANGFPSEAEDLFSYKSIVLDDIEADFFTPDQQELLNEFVSKRGGGLLMLGGSESFADGDYQDSLLQTLLPIYLGRGGEISEEERELAIDLTKEGMLEFWLRLRAQEVLEKQRIREMPFFSNVNEVRNPKPGAHLLATVTDQETGMALPALCVQRYGSGRVAALMIGDIWKWGFLEPGQQTDRDKMWRQLMRHLTVDVPSRIEVSTRAGRQTTNEEVIEVRLRDKAFDPQFNGKVTLTVSEPSGESYEFPATPEDREAGLYTGTFLPNVDGGYRVDVSVEPMNDGELTWEDQESGWSVNSNAKEFASLGINENWMKQIADATGGKVLSLDQVNELPKLIQRTEVPEVEYRVSPLWHTPWFFILAVACFVGEWAIRRNAGYA